MDKEVVIELFNRASGDNACVLENGHTYEWDKLGVSCWQDITSEDANEMIREAKADGMYDEMREDIERDDMRSKKFDTIVIRK